MYNMFRNTHDMTKFLLSVGGEAWFYSFLVYLLIEVVFKENTNIDSDSKYCS